MLYILFVWLSFQVPNNAVVDIDSAISYDAALRQVVISTILTEEGCYKAKVTYQGQLLRGGDFNIVVLNGGFTLLSYLY